MSGAPRTHGDETRRPPADGWMIGYRGTCFPADCDHMGHMNVAAYVKKFDEATWVLWDAVGFSAKRMQADARGLAALKSEVEYRHEVFPGQSLSVRSSIVEVGAKTARFRHVMHVSTEEGPAPAAICTYLVCCLDRAGRKGAEWPADMAESLAAWAAAAASRSEDAAE